ncbi:hypothetical protein B0H67DRAFT_320124 [Lasiosphaeris hirsuta]|uniref:Uncharacterized protein n=1 Tax=Lasiosphaeris hirsuta TaxID=260670 RepID=A0AA40A262_9PEZI|nr:hypothetical protein B0H67DRAFT_320124 [Lasiosphaeris hirsuta]
MSSAPRRQNSANPRPGNSNFPRMSMRSGATNSQHIRSGSTASQQSRSGPRPSLGPAPRPTAATHDDAATKKQINQTLAITMMSCPINPLPFPLPIPLGVTMLLSPSSGNRKGSASSQT